MQVAVEELPTGWLVHDLITRPPSANVTSPVGASGPASVGATSAVYVTGPSTFGVKSGVVTVVEVESLSIENAAGWLADPSKSDPGVGLNTAVTRAGDDGAANEVAQVTVTDGVDCDGIGTAAHPLIGEPLSWKATVPDGGATIPATDVTVPINVTPWFVTRVFCARQRSVAPRCQRRRTRRQLRQRGGGKIGGSIDGDNGYVLRNV